MTTTTAAKRELTGAQRRVYDLVEAAVREKGYPPTYREIQVALGFASTAAAYGHVRAVQKKGWITRGYGYARALVPRGARADPAAWAGPIPAAAGGLSPAGRLAYLFLRRCWAECGRAPSLAEIRDALGYKAVRSAQLRVAELEAAGLVRHERYRARTLVLVPVPVPPAEGGGAP